MKQLITTRLRLVPLRVDHAGAMFSLLSDPRIYEFIQDEPPASLESLQERYHRHETRHSPDGTEQWLNWIIQPLESDACMGFIQATIYTSATADFAFVLGPSYWGRGLALEAASSALHTLFTDYAIISMFAMADERNVRSTSLLTRLGFQRVECVNHPHRAVLPSDHLFLLNRRLNTP
ncbi:MAG: GNAT family N-acetyltransferase [Prosthecobacter sp.]|uniref:GNAT family N-acetyltransferase n=1 Tax=Prosthecobacter sp. TaxID=1965333 RepID=UPI002616AFC4|nr:GNAT family N-acetyltransferase [Prosthecobacter sp.]MCF7790295.1 GNAT family N-acetyltransferase [Prosthecobacter sp.]